MLDQEGMSIKPVFLYLQSSSCSLANHCKEFVFILSVQDTFAFD
jgi:hypothetical protein